MFIISAWWNVWGGNPEYKGTSAHCYLLLTVPVGRSSWVTRTSLGFWEHSLLWEQTPLQLSDQTNPTLDPIKCSLLVQRYRRWLVALHSHLRLRQWQENCICLSHELILSDSSAEYFPVPTTGIGVSWALFLAQPWFTLQEGSSHDLKEEGPVQSSAYKHILPPTTGCAVSTPW